MLVSKAQMEAGLVARVIQLIGSMRVSDYKLLNSFNFILCYIRTITVYITSHNPSQNFLNLLNSYFNFFFYFNFPLRGPGEKFTYVNLGTSDRWVGIRTGTGVTATLYLYLF